MDEKPYQLLDDVYPSLVMHQGCTEKVDYKYIRHGTCNIFLFSEPLGGWRHADALLRRTKVDWAHKIRWLLLGQYLDAEKVVLVLDNLDTHVILYLYGAFCAGEAFSLAQRLEIHYTSKHGSWFNIAEIELSALAVQCLGKRRISDINALNVELSSWHTQRNQIQKGVDWQFTTKNARIKLKKLYPITM